MPEAIGAAIVTAVASAAGVAGSATIASTAIIGSVTIGTAVGYAVTTAASIGLSYALQGLNENGRRAPEQLTVRQPIPARMRGHGRAKLGGALFFFDTLDGKQVRGLVHCVGPISSYQEFWLGSTKTELPAGSLGGTVTALPIDGQATIESHLGHVDQAASPMLLQAPYWGENARLLGLAYSAVECRPGKHGDKNFPEGAPIPRVVADLVPCWDPRDPSQNRDDPSTWKWSDNAAIVLLEWIHHASGFEAAWEDINVQSFADAANVDDEDIPLRVPELYGATSEKRHRSWGVYEYTETRAAVLARYLAARDGELYQDQEGRIALRGGCWREPVVTITEDMVLGWDEWEEGDETTAGFNRLKWTYTSPGHDFQPTEGEAWDDPDAQEAAGYVIQTERDFRRAPSHGQGRRLAAIAYRRANARYRFRGLRLQPAGLRAYGEENIRLTLPSLGIDTTFTIERCRLEGATLTMLTLDLYSLTADAFASTLSDQGTAPQLPDLDEPDPPPVPTDGYFAIERTAVNGSVTQLIARFGTGAEDTTSLTLEGRYRRAGTQSWIDMVRSGNNPVTQPLDESVPYEAQLAWSSGVAISAYGPTIEFTAVADAVSPGPPVDVGVQGGAGELSVSLVTPNAGNLGTVRVYVGSSAATLAQARPGPIVNAAPNQGLTITAADQTPGAKRVWVRAFNRSGFPSDLSDLSSTVGPLNVTVL